MTAPTRRWCCSLLGKEQDGNIVCSKGPRVRWDASANDCLMIFSGVQARLELGGKLSEVVGGIAHDKPGLAGTCVAGGHAAGAAGIFYGVGLFAI